MAAAILSKLSRFQPVEAAAILSKLSRFQPVEAAAILSFALTEWRTHRVEDS